MCFFYGHCICVANHVPLLLKWVKNSVGVASLLVPNQGAENRNVASRDNQANYLVCILVSPSVAVAIGFSENSKMGPRGLVLLGNKESIFTDEN